MSYRKLDANHIPLPRKRRTKREAATRLERDVTLYHYEITYVLSLGGGKRKHVRRRFWLPGDVAAAAKERELRYDAPAHALTWGDAYSRWKADRTPHLSQGHLGGVEITMNKWFASFGASSTVEGTTLPAFVEWLQSQAKGNKGRGAQLRRSHLLTIARWCRSRGFVEKIPFEHAPKPDAKMERRRPATVDEFFSIAEILPPQMVWMWRMLGLTGMRISAACTLLESDIGAESFTVTTKGDKRVEYPITPGIREVIDGARAWKLERGFSPPTLFCSHRGRRWTHYHFSEQLRKRAKDYKITPHQLRHMAGTIMAEGNLSPDIIQAGLGHSDRSSSEVYIDQTRAMRKTALAAVSKALGDSKKIATTDTQSARIASSEPESTTVKMTEDGRIVCPCCSCNILIEKD